MLYIFDLDGTLVKTYGREPLPNVHAQLEQIARDGHSIAVATNQAGLAWRIWTHDTKFPDVPSMANRFENIALDLPTLQHAPWFVSLFDSRIALTPLQYQNLSFELENACRTLKVQARAIPEWRKPQPGMLVAAGQYFNHRPDEAVFIGDHKTDAEAAASANMQFQWAADFFNFKSPA